MLGDISTTLDIRVKMESSLSYLFPYFDLAEKSHTVTNIKTTKYIP